LDFGRFLDEHRPAWRQLEHLLDEAERKGLKRLEPEQVRDLARLYRKASADLLLARDTAGRADVTDYLEALVGRAYTRIYSARRLRLGAVLSWFIRGWPEAVRREKRYLQLSASVFFLGLLAAFLLVSLEPDAFDYLVPSEIASFYAERPDDYRDARFGEMTDQDSASFSTMLMVNNIRVALRSFVLGLTLGVGTLMTLFYNGVLLGAIAANFATWDQNVEFWALILPHGVFEIFAIALGGAGGFILADAILRPGRRRRIDALKERGLDALKLIGMAVPFLVFAGLVEGYVTPMSILPDLAKIAFALLTAIGLGVYLTAPWLAAMDDAPDQPPRTVADIW